MPDVFFVCLNGHRLIAFTVAAVLPNYIHDFSMLPKVEFNTDRKYPRTSISTQNQIAYYLFFQKYMYVCAVDKSFESISFI